MSRVFIDLFRPAPGNTKVVTVSATATNVALPGVGTNFRVVNNSGTGIFFQLGDSTASATVSDTFMLNGTAEVFSRKRDETHISIRTLSGAGTGPVYVEAGEGS